MSFTVEGSFYIETDCKIKINGLKLDTGMYINDAQLTGTLMDKKHQAVANGEVVFNYIPDSDGNYEGILDSDAVMTESHDYDLYCVAIKAGRKMTMRIRRKANYLQG